MKRIPIAHAAGLLACLALAAGVAECTIHVDKDANGKEKNVQVDTPFGGVHVNTNQTTAADLGLPAYPARRSLPIRTTTTTSLPTSIWGLASGNCA